MYISDIKIVDLSFSKWDEKKSNPQDGEYEFDEKVYIDMYGNKESRPPWFFTWCRYSPQNNYREFREWKVTGYTAVNVDEDKYWPEPLPPNENGHYVFGDVILVKRKLIDELKERLERQTMSKGAAAARLRDWQEKMEREGAAIPESMVKDLLGG